MPEVPRVPQPALPSDIAWFVFDPGIERQPPHLGAVVPDDERATWFDLGELPYGELGIEPWLREELMTSAELRARIASEGARLGGPPLRFLAPVVRPSKIVCLGKNFAAHAAEMGGEAPAEPLFFGKVPDTLRGHGAPIGPPRRQLDRDPEGRLDHEAELALILGWDDQPDGARDVEPDEAWRLVAGLTIANDVTARSLQQVDKDRGWPWFQAKCFDGSLPLGPFVVPTDNRPVDLAGRRVRAHVDGHLRQDGDLGAMVHGIGVALAAISRCTTLRAGDVVLMGTPEGVGPLTAGETVTVSVDGLGSLSNPVVGPAGATG